MKISCASLINEYNNNIKHISYLVDINFVIMKRLLEGVIDEVIIQPKKVKPMIGKLNMN